MPGPDAILLAVDQAITSGWALIRACAFVPFAWGTTTTLAHRAAVFNRALEAAAPNPRRIWLVLEDHSQMPLTRGTRNDVVSRKSGSAGTRNTAGILGQGAAAGRWKEHAELRGIPKSHFLQVTPRAWRSAVLGRKWATAKTEAARAESQRWASALLGVPVDHDAAAAIAMAVMQAREISLACERAQLAKAK